MSLNVNVLKKVSLAAVGMIAIDLTGATHAFAASIGFEGLPGGTVVTNQFSDVVFSANAGFVNKVTTQPGLGFGNNFICTAPTAGGINCTQETILTFSSGVNNLSFYQVGDNASGVVALVDVFENGLFSSTVNILGFNDPFVPNLVDLTGFSNVSSIRIYNVTDPAGLGWDNFQFDVATNPVSTPEPTSTLSLLALGTLGTASTLKRKLKSSKLTEKETTKVS